MTSTNNLVSVRKNIKRELAEVEVKLVETAAQIAQVLEQNKNEAELTAVIFLRENLREQRNRLRHTDIIINESDRISFIIPNLICMGKDYKVNNDTLGVIIDILGE